MVGLILPQNPGHLRQLHSAKRISAVLLAMRMARAKKHKVGGSSTILTYLRFLLVKPFALFANWYYNPPVPLEWNYIEGQTQTSNILQSSKSNLRVRIRSLKNTDAERAAVQKILCDAIMSTVVGHFVPCGIRMKGSFTLCTATVGVGAVISIVLRKLIRGILTVESILAIDILIYFWSTFTAYVIVFTLLRYRAVFNYLFHSLETDIQDPYAHYCNVNNGCSKRNFFVATAHTESDPSNEAIIGTIAVQEPQEGSPFNPATDAEIRRVAIVPNARGHGITRMLYNRVETFVESYKKPLLPVKRMVLSTTSAQRKALVVYNHYGFRELTRDPLDCTFDLVSMVKDIVD